MSYGSRALMSKYLKPANKTFTQILALIFFDYGVSWKKWSVTFNDLKKKSYYKKQKNKISDRLETAISLAKLVLLPYYVLYPKKLFFLGSQDLFMF